MLRWRRRQPSSHGVTEVEKGGAPAIVEELVDANAPGELLFEATVVRDLELECERAAAVRVLRLRVHDRPDLQTLVRPDRPAPFADEAHGLEQRTELRDEDVSDRERTHGAMIPEADALRLSGARLSPPSSRVLVDFGADDKRRLRERLAGGVARGVRGLPPR